MKKALLITVCATVMMMAQKASAIPTRCDEYDYDNCYEIFVDDEGYTHKIHYGYDVGEGDEGDLEHYDVLSGEKVYNSDGKVIKEYSPYDHYGSYSSDNMYQTAAYEYTNGKLTQKTTYKNYGSQTQKEEWFDDQGRTIKETTATTTREWAYTENGYIKHVMYGTESYTMIHEDENEIKYDSNGNISTIGNLDALLSGNEGLPEGFFTKEALYADEFEWIKDQYNLSDNAIGVALPVDPFFNGFILDGDKIVVYHTTEAWTPNDPDWEEVMPSAVKDAYNKLSLVTDGNIKRVMYDGEVLYEITYDSNGKITNVKDRQGTDYAGTFNFNEYVANLNKRTTEVKNPDGSYTIYDKDGNFLGFKGKRIYTVEEANLVAKPTGNTIRIKYH